MYMYIRSAGSTRREKSRFSQRLRARVRKIGEEWEYKQCANKCALGASNDNLHNESSAGLRRRQRRSRASECGKPLLIITLNEMRTPSRSLRSGLKLYISVRLQPRGIRSSSVCVWCVCVCVCVCMYTRVYLGEHAMPPLYIRLLYSRYINARLCGLLHACTRRTLFFSCV